jgi:hypothetical protein
MNNVDGSNAQERAYAHVGRFIYQFARVEQKIDQALIKLSDLDERVTPIVAIIDFGRKVDLMRRSANAQVSNAKDKKFANETCDRVHEINRHRRMIAHVPFEPASSGAVQFRKTVTKDGVVCLVDEPWTDKEFSECYEEMSALEIALNRLIELIKPVPFFNWSGGGFQEMYHRRHSGFHNTSGPGTPLALADTRREWVPGPSR